MAQFYMFDKKLMMDKRLGNDERVCYTLLADRMKSSEKRSEFFDEKEQAYYVIYTIEELIETLGTKRNKTINILKKLEKYGYIVKKRNYSKATKLFLPNLNQPAEEKREEAVSLKNKPIEVYKTNSNHTNYNHTNYTDDTDDTRWDVLEDIIENKVKAKPQPKEVVEEPKEDVSEVMKKDAVEVLGQSLTESGLTEPLVATLKAYAFNDADKLYSYAGMIFKAKSVAKKNAERVIGSANTAFRFELNNFMTDKLTADIKKIIITSQRVANNKNGYIMRSLINLFEEQANVYLVA